METVKFGETRAPHEAAPSHTHRQGLAGVLAGVMPKRILITGAKGFVGRHLSVALRQWFPEVRLHAAGFDVTDARAVDQEVRAVRPDACVHLAAVSAIADARRDPDRAWQVNLHGTLNLARAIMSHAPACVFLLASSADAYGASFKGGQPVDETVPLAPLNSYGATKAAADLAVGALAAEGLHTVRLRPFNHTGPGQTDGFVVAAFARQIARIRLGLQAPLLRVGALDPYRDFLDVRDVCAAYAACLARAAEIPPGSIFNIASGTPRRIGDMLEDMQRLAGTDAAIETDASRLRPTDIPVACGNAAAAFERLGWAPRIAWETTLRDVLADWLAREGPAGG